VKTSLIGKQLTSCCSLWLKKVTCLSSPLIDNDEVNDDDGDNASAIQSSLSKKAIIIIIVILTISTQLYSRKICGLTSFPVTLWPPSFNHRLGTIAQKYGPHTPGTNVGSWLNCHDKKKHVFLLPFDLAILNK